MSPREHTIVRFRGSEPLRALVLESLAGREGTQVLAESGRRELLQLPAHPATGTGALVLKRYRVPPHRRLRERIKRRFGFGSGAREWRALQALGRPLALTPEPLAHALLGDGTEVLLRRHTAGVPLLERIDSARRT